MTGTFLWWNLYEDCVGNASDERSERARVGRKIRVLKTKIFTVSLELLVLITWQFSEKDHILEILILNVISDMYFEKVSRSSEDLNPRPSVCETIGQTSKPPQLLYRSNFEQLMKKYLTRCKLFSNSNLYKMTNLIFCINFHFSKFIIKVEGFQALCLSSDHIFTSFERDAKCALSRSNEAAA